MLETRWRYGLDHDGRIFKTFDFEFEFDKLINSLEALKRSQVKHSTKYMFATFSSKNCQKAFN